MKANSRLRAINVVLALSGCLVISLLSGCCSSVALVEDRVIARSDTLVNVLRNDPTPRLQLVSVTQPEHATAKIVGDSLVEVSPEKSYEGRDEFSYIVVDSSKKQHCGKVNITVLPSVIKEMAITLVAAAKETSETYHLRLLIGSEVAWDSVVGDGESWQKGHRELLRADLSSSDAVLFEKIEQGKLIVSKDPFTNPYPSPLLEITVVLDNGRSIMVLPRTAKPDSVDLASSTWIWSLQKDPFGGAKDEGDEFGKGDTVYSITVGASFDFLNKLSIDDVFSSINLFAPSLLWRFGVDAGFFQYRNIGVSQRPVSIDKYRKVNGADTAGITTVYNTQVTNRTDNLGLYANPTFKVTRGLYWFLNFEFRRRKIVSTTEYTATTSDTIPNISANDFSYQAHPDPKFSNPIPEEEIKNDLLIGSGFTVTFEDRNVSFEISPFAANDLRGKWSLVFQFDLLVKKSGLILGGEVRSLGAFSPGSSKDYLIYLAKQYPITAISDFFTGK